MVGRRLFSEYTMTSDKYFMNQLNDVLWAYTTPDPDLQRLVREDDFYEWNDERNLSFKTLSEKHGIPISVVRSIAYELYKNWGLEGDEYINFENEGWLDSALNIKAIALAAIMAMGLGKASADTVPFRDHAGNLTPQAKAALGVINEEDKDISTKELHKIMKAMEKNGVTFVDDEGFKISDLTSGDWDKVLAEVDEDNTDEPYHYYSEKEQKEAKKKMRKEQKKIGWNTVIGQEDDK